MGGRPPYVPPKPFDPKKGMDALSNSWIARGEWAKKNPKKSGYTVPQIPPPPPPVDNPVKPANTNNYEEKIQETKADFSIEERVAFMALTGTEILEVSRNFNMSSNSLSLNKNVLDSVAIVNAVNPIQLIKTQNSNTDYIAKSSSTVENTAVAIVQTTGNVTVTAPAVSVLTTPAQPATTTTTTTTPVNTNQVKAETLKPTAVVTQTTTPPHRILSFTPGSAKKGARVTITHERCNATGRVVQVGSVTVSAPLVVVNSKTISFPVPNSVSLVVGQQYKISVTIGGIKAEAPGTLTILA